MVVTTSFSFILYNTVVLPGGKVEIDKSFFKRRCEYSLEESLGSTWDFGTYSTKSLFQTHMLMFPVDLEVYTGSLDWVFI